MLKTENRLKRKKDIDKVHRSKKGVFDAVSGVKWIANEEGVPRFVIAAGLKVSKKAVERNRVKRQYREHLKTWLEAISEKSGGVDVMVILSSKALDMQFEDQAERLKKVLKKAKLI
jgi:ribonuclease P protein component